MKKLVILILAAVLLSGCSFGTRVYTNESAATFPSIPDMEMVVEKYYVIQEINKEYADGRTERVEYERVEKPMLRYDGQLRTCNESAKVYENDELVRSEAYVVDDRVNVIRMVPDGEESKALDYQLTYDEKNNVTEKRTLEAGLKTKRETFSYNEYNQVTEHCEYEGETLIFRSVTEYGETGWRKAVTCYDGNGNIVTRQECTADEKKYSETVLEYDAAGTLLRRLENGYDVGKNLVAQEVFDADGQFMERTYWRYLTGSYSYLVPAE